MRASTALLALGCVAAAVAEDVVVEDAPVESSATSSAKLAAFTPTSLKAPFLEQFVDGWDARWKPSHAKKENTEEEWQYVGTWKAEEPVELTGLTGDNGLVLKDKAAHHAISAKFDTPIDNAGKTLVVQYEVKLQNSLECGGAYMKLLQDGAALASDEFSNASPYIIMFGPDKCGSTNKVHFIFRHKNPVSGVYEEKHLEAPPAAVIDRLVNLYTLIVRPDQTFEILINGESSKKGSLLENFLPAVIPPKEIDDENDSKPADWVDAEKMPDPDAVKPEDWDEDAPYEIVDESAEKPADWLEDEPSTIPDPEAAKPEDWDDEEDGDWIAPQVANPKCDDAAGCGKWEKPTIKNPAYKGKWMRPWIENPEYKGLWAPRKIANPNYFETSTPADFEPIGGIGFELWTMNEDILFDNIYIGHSVEDAKALQKETFDVKKASEDKAAADWKKEQDKLKPKSPSDLVFLDDPVLYIKEKTQLFITLAQKNPVDAVKFVPEVAGAIGVGLITILVLLAGAVGGGAAAAKNAPSKEEIKKKADEAKKAATKAKDDAVAAVSSGAEKVQSEVNKRTGKSS